MERFAPGFGELVLARTVQTPRTMPQDNRCLHSGAVNSGTAGLHQQLVLRPVPGLGRPETPIESLYLASASAHPGGGVHGAPGANAARAAVAGAPSRQARACGRRPAVAGLTATGLTGLVAARRPGPRGVIWLTAGAAQTCGPDRVPPCRVRIEAGIRRAGEARRDRRTRGAALAGAPRAPAAFPPAVGGLPRLPAGVARHQLVDGRRRAEPEQAHPGRVLVLLPAGASRQRCEHQLDRQCDQRDAATTRRRIRRAAPTRRSRTSRRSVRFRPRTTSPR